MANIKVSVAKDKELVEMIRKQLSENGGYCPCRLEHTADTKCMCKEFRDQISNNISGTCHCGLYEVIAIEN